MLEDARGYGSTSGNSSFSLKWQLIKTRCDEMGGCLGALIGLEPDIMYDTCPSRRTNDDWAFPRLLVWVFPVVCSTSFCQTTCLPGRFFFFLWCYSRLSGEDNGAVVPA